MDTIILNNKCYIKGFASAVGSLEGQGLYGKYFDAIFDDPLLEQNTWEKAESELQRFAIDKATKKAHLENKIELIIAGDLLNQCTASTFSSSASNTPFIGVYGACSTMALSMAVGSFLVSGGLKNNVVAATSSHFCSSERQYRFPLEYGGQRTPSQQHTVTGAGAVVLTNEKTDIYLNAVTLGKIVDLGIKDANNMGAAMAPDDVKIRPYPTNEGMVFFYTQIQYLRGFRALFKDFKTQKIVEKSVNEIYAQSRNYYKKEEEF